MDVSFTSTSTNSPYEYDHPDWLSLPPHIVFLILGKLVEALDHVRVKAVCKQWQSLSQEYNHKTQRWHTRPPPMLLILTRPPKRKRSFGNATTKLSGVLYSAAEGTVYTNIRLSIPDHLNNRNQLLCSCGHGWLAKVEPHRNEGQARITLFNPFEKAGEITLPPLHCAYKHNGKMKVTLSADPNLNRDSYVVVVISLDRNMICFFNSANMSWTHNIEVRDNSNNNYDAVFHKGKVYAVSDSVLSVFVVERNHPRLRRVYKRARVDSSRNWEKYLVESTEGELLYVQGPDVYKLVFEEGVNKVTEVKVTSIGDDALFLGHHPSLAVSTSDKFRGCQPNYIYFSSELAWLCVYDLKDRTRPRYPKPQNVHMKHTFWITPPFNGLC